MIQSTFTHEIETNSPITADLKLSDILKKLPKEIFLKNRRQAWTTLIINVVMVIIGYVGLVFAPWYLLPFAWIFVGTALTGFFVIAHDCGHRSFAQRKWVNDLVGHTLTLPLIYPFHAWRILHNHHHKHTNKLDIDNAWSPFTSEFYDSFNKPLRWGYQALRGKFWWVASIVHWLTLHFNWLAFEGKEKEQIRYSVLVVLIGSAIGFPLLIATTGFWGLIKFWFIPWLVYHFWMSTFTLVHHTTPDIGFFPAEKWNEAKAQLSGTVHCEYPFWVEFLCHDINVHIPHHICRSIPSYNLREAYKIIKQYWGDECKESKFSWALMKEITDNCHLHSNSEYYQTFKYYHSQIKG